VCELSAPYSADQGECKCLNQVIIIELDNIEKAEQAFKASLRANGLYLLSIHYLAAINHRLGNDDTALEYVKAYNEQIRYSKNS